MTKQLFGTALAAGLALAGGSGCHTPRQACYAPCPPQRACEECVQRPPLVGVRPAHPLTPMDSAPIDPAAAPPAGYPPLGSALPPGTAAPPADNNWRPAGPESLPPGATPPREAVQLYPPNSPEPPQANPSPDVRRADVREEPSRPSPPADRGTPPLPVSIEQFAVVRDREVYAGLKPSLEGLQWLKANGYRAVLYVRELGQHDAADRRQIEQLGLTYLSLEVSPQTLNKAVADNFNRLVGDRANYPLFVYDRSGALAGGLWYLHYRTARNESDEAARIMARQLGLKEDRDGEHRDMWLAVQKYLSEQANK
jgi:protein tyrosine phosphatase (PTP) superfamily phosphohydrolase (DUF442 family)